MTDSDGAKASCTLLGTRLATQPGSADDLNHVFYFDLPLAVLLRADIVGPRRRNDFPSLAAIVGCHFPMQDATANQASLVKLGLVAIADRCPQSLQSPPELRAAEEPLFTIVEEA